MPRELWPGDADHGRLILDGYFRFDNHSVRRENVLAGTVRPGEAWMVEFHSCSWLHDLRAADENASDVARSLIGYWIRRNRNWDTLSWRPDVLSKRLCNWLSSAAFLSLDDDRMFADVFFENIARQTRHLRRVSRFVESDLERLSVDNALLYSALCLTGGTSQVLGLVQRIADTCERQFLADGGHIARNPTQQVESLRRLVDIQNAVEGAGFEMPEAFEELVARAAAVTRLFLHGDQRLALFNGADEGAPQLIDLALSGVKRKVRPPNSAPDIGFERIEAHRTLLIADTGRPKSGIEGMHAGSLSFELSVGRQRMIVNCGAYSGSDDSWKTVQRSTAAHSTLAVEDRNSSFVREDGTLGRVPKTVTCKRTNGDTHIVLDMSHDGYRPQFGLTHIRRLAVDLNGTSILGEDLLAGKGEHKFVVRFHLHPTIKASLLKGGASVLLRLLDGSGWRFRCDGGITSLHESVYLGQAGQTRRSEQIVVSSATSRGEASVQWSLAKL